jgi:hypothetical protein
MRGALLERPHDSVQPHPAPRRRHTTFERARRASVWGLAIFLSAQLGMAVALDVWLPEVGDPAYGMRLRQLQDRLQQSSAPTELIVMLGSSRVAFGCNGAVVEDELSRALGRPVIVYNFGRLGGGPITERLYLQRLLAQGIRPALLLLEANPIVMTRAGASADLDSLHVGPLEHNDRALLERFGAAPAPEDAPPAWVDHCVPILAHRRAILYRCVPTLLSRDVRAHCTLQWWKNLNASGWVGCERGADPQAHEAAHLQQLEPLLSELNGMRWTAELPSCRALEEALELARTEGIPTALVLMPESPTLRRAYSPGSWERARDYFRGLSDRYGCPAIEAREWIAGDDFADPDHLTARGAHAFTERLGREALAPLLVSHRRAESRKGPR